MKQRYLPTLSLILIIMSFLLLNCGVSSALLEPSQTDFPDADLLVSADSVQSSIGEPNLVIIDARPNTSYTTSHIPGAINLIFGDFLTPGKGLKAVATLNTKLGAAGLTTGKTFVIYDNTTDSFGAAGRLFWMLEYLGCRDVHILDGGWDKWVADLPARPTETTVNTLAETKFRAEIEPALKAKAAHIKQKLNDKNNFAIVDTRTDEEFIGWQLYGEARGGHIPGAIQIPYAWYFNADKTVVNYTNLQAMFTSRGVTPDKEVVTYCTEGIRSGFAYFLLRLMAYPTVANYDGSMLEWAAITSYPEEKAARFSTIVYPAWVKALIDYHAPNSTSARPAQYPYDRNHKYLVLESPARSTVQDDTTYQAGHIPGAVHSNDYLLEGPYPGYYLLPDADLKTAVGNLGVTPDTTVVVYAYTDSVSYAARLWWVLKYAGVKDVRFLNGQYQAWTASGYASETGINYPVAVTYTGTPHHEYLATTDYVYNKLINKKPMYIGDARSYLEHIGDASGYPRLIACGRIPGATWVQNGSTALGTATPYGDSDGTLRSYTEIYNLWKTSGIVSTKAYKTFSKELIFHCGNGYRSSLTFLYAYMMGYDNVRNFSNGWFDWSTVFTQDASCADSVATPGWCQTPSGRPFDTGPD